MLPMHWHLKITLAQLIEFCENEVKYCVWQCCIELSNFIVIIKIWQFWTLGSIIHLTNTLSAYFIYKLSFINVHSMVFISKLLRWVQYFWIVRWVCCWSELQQSQNHNLWLTSSRQKLKLHSIDLHNPELERVGC